MEQKSNWSILSTKKLSLPQQELVLNTGVGLVHYDILEIEAVNSRLQLEGNGVIVTSKNALFALHQVPKTTPLFCVGEITASLITSHDVVFVAENAGELAQYLIKNHSHVSLDYVCSEQRRDELPHLLRSHKMSLKEHIVYRSHAVNKSFDRIFAAVLFYSPRGVLAFAKANKSQPHRAVCIGETTAKEAKKWFNNVLVAKKPTVENTIVTTIKSLRND